MNQGKDLSNSRTVNSAKNAIYAIICQLITIFLGFVTRSIFIKFLSQEYLGINSVFSNVLSFLSLADLGIGNVLLYNLYKPLKENNVEKINSILKVFKKYYTKIAILIFCLGILVIPFLPLILNGVDFNIGVLIIYLLFLINTTCSYFYAYKSFLLTADQKNYVTTRISIITTTLKECIQIIVLIIFKSYYLFLIVTILSTLSKNILINIKCNKMYSFLNKNCSDIDDKNRVKIKSDLKDIFLYKVSGVALNGTDNILISSLLTNGTIISGIYSNYLLIITSLNSVITSSFQALTGSLGNLNAEGNADKDYEVLSSLSFASYWINGVCAICLYVLFNPFIRLYAGESYLLPINTVIIIVISFYVSGTFTPIWIYRETAGIFKKSKYAALILAICNIILSVILGIFFGLNGILGATIISRLLTTYWYEPYIIFKKYLNKSFVKYFVDNIAFVIKILFTCIIIHFLFANLTINNYFDFLVYGLLIFILSNIILLIFNFRKKEFLFLTRKIKNMIVEFQKKHSGGTNENY